ncbi:2-methylcitrate dehydratase PrpD [Rhizobium sp. BK650]|uniref:MmgE/PrpD family protein n=1 Tax=Rhizobium sp. BK650 TaxID=2586990 RepID=UPI00161D803C|nr:MmgE/PrpD family protein [Rhizobium sp. BK650]MBB3659727.1 2-methylcitrate dehydratase PrpD [Rhizobium sp. BK650]
MTTTCESKAHDEMAFVTSHLATLCTSVSVAPAHVLDATRRTLVDTIGAAAAGAATKAGKASLIGAPLVWGGGDCSIWFSRRRSTAAGAAFVNATFAAALDLDDGHRLASGHPAAAIVPSVLACAEHSGAGAVAILTAIALGYEVAVRVSGSRDIDALRTTDSGLWCGYGVAAATAWLCGLSADIMSHALAITGQTSTSQPATGFTRIGHTVKEGIPWATANGIQAVMLAKAGHRGPTDILDDTDIYDRERLVGSLNDAWAIEGAYFKLYSCCRWAHAAIDGALALQVRMSLRGREIDTILVETFERALSLPNVPDPSTSEAAQYSIPFCVALALVHGEQALLPLKEEHLGDASVIALARRIKLVSSRNYEHAFPASTPARVTIVGKGLIEQQEVLSPRGEPLSPLAPAMFEAKFRALTKKSPVDGKQAEALLEAASRFGIDRGSSDLYSALSVYNA